MQFCEKNREKLYYDLQQMTEPDRDVDRFVGLILGGWRTSKFGSTRMLDALDGSYAYHPGSLYPSPTGSVDEAMKVFNHALPDYAINIGNDNRWWCHIWKDTPDYDGNPYMGRANLQTAAILMATAVAVDALFFKRMLEMDALMDFNARVDGRSS